MTTDFVIGLSRIRRKHDTIWIIVDLLTKLMHFLAIMVKLSLESLIDLYIAEIVKLRGVLKGIVSDRVPRFISIFWHAFQNILDTKIKRSSAFHTQIDGQSKLTISTLEDMLRADALE